MGLRWHRLYVPTWWAVVAACAAPLAAGDGMTAQDAAAILTKHGLARIDRVWVAPEELRLRQQLSDLPKRRERILALEHELDDRIEQNRKHWQEAQPAIAALRKSLARFGSDDPQRVLVQQQIDALLAASAEPAKLGSRGEVRTRVLAWIDERNGLATTITQIRSAIAGLAGLYERLAQTPGVSEALRSAGDKHRLGPQRNYTADRDKLADYERLTFTPWVPFYFQGTQIRVTALIDDSLPVTCTWSDSSGPGIVLTRTAAEAAGLAIPASAPREPLERASGERTMARRIEVPRLRLGKCVLKQVSVLVLPPEAEHWGCELRREALAGHSVRLEPERLRLTIDAG